MNHPPSEVMYALEMAKSKSLNTWTTSNNIPVLFMLSTWAQKEQQNKHKLRGKKKKRKIFILRLN